MGVYFSKHNDEESANSKNIDNNQRVQELEEEIEKLKYQLKNNHCLHYYKTGHIINHDIEKAKEQKDYEYLVFSGGGIKGISYCGSIDVLTKLDILFREDILKVKGIAGTSAGSIMASLLAIGYKPDELKPIMMNLNFEHIIDDQLGYIHETYNFVEHYGLCPGKYINNLLGDLIKKKTGNPDYTIKQLYEETGMFLVIVGTNMNRKRSVYFYPTNSKREYSEIPIRVAIRISMGIPYLFEPLKYDNDMWVDGGVLDNYPLHVFDGEYPGDVNARLYLTKPNPKVLGLHIMTTDDVISYELKKRVDILSLYQYSISYIELFLAENERRMMVPSFWQRTINIITPDIPLSDFKLTDKQKEDLVSIGREYAEKFFN